MPHSFGLRARTREKYSCAFRKHGTIALSQYLQPFKKGDYVDIVCNPSQQKGMPYQFYHGRTGRVYGVFKRAVGVEVSKVLRQRKIMKRIVVRTEHVKLSRCREDFVRRCKEKDALRHSQRQGGVKAIDVSASALKRKHKLCRNAVSLSTVFNIKQMEMLLPQYDGRDD